MSASGMVNGSDIQIGDEIWLNDKRWIMRGWYSAVGHLAVETPEGERRVLSRHDQYWTKRVKQTTVSNSDALTS
jgi:hypothetical protein